MRKVSLYRERAAAEASELFGQLIRFAGAASIGKGDIESALAQAQCDRTAHTFRPSRDQCNTRFRHRSSLTHSRAPGDGLRADLRAGEFYD
jgi:hypothetical protein